MSRLPHKDELQLFKQLVNENRYDFCKLVYIIFPFGEKDHELEHKAPYDWQMREWAKISKHLSDPFTRYETYRLLVSSGNGAAKTAFGAMTYFMLMYTQLLKARITANTQPQMKSVIWPEYDKWFRYARYSDNFFEKLGESIKAKDPVKGETWRLDAVTWNEATPAAMSGLHNAGNAILYTFEEAPGIPSIIWNYVRGAFTDANTIKLWLAFGNSDDPESQFEQNMTSPEWRSLRIDTRTLPHIDPKETEGLLAECNGNEDHDEFRVRVRGLPRKANKDSIISMDAVEEAIKRGSGFDIAKVSNFPLILMCDPAWRGGDYTVIAYRQGFYICILEKYKLGKEQDHSFTYHKMTNWERELGADAVFIDQGEGTALKTLANNDGRNWELFSFANTPHDSMEFKDSQYSNLRAQMYYETDAWLREGGVLDAKEDVWVDEMKKQLCWTKGTRHKTHGKKLAEPKADIKIRVGQSPDIADAVVLAFARKVTERLPDNDRFSDPMNRATGGGAWKMPEHGVEDTYADSQYDPYSEPAEHYRSNVHGKTSR